MANLTPVFNEAKIELTLFVYMFLKFIHSYSMETQIAFFEGSLTTYIKNLTYV